MKKIDQLKSYRQKVSNLKTGRGDELLTVGRLLGLSSSNFEMTHESHDDHLVIVWSLIRNSDPFEKSTPTIAFGSTIRP